MPAYLPPVLLQLRVSAREAYTELAKFQAAVESTMKETAAAVNAQGANIGTKAGDALGENVGKAAAKKTTETFQAEMRKRSALWMRALNIDPSAYAAGVRMAQVAIKALATEWGRNLGSSLASPFRRAADALRPVMGSLRTQFRVLGVYARDGVNAGVGAVEGLIQRFPLLHAAVMNVRAGFGLLRERLSRVREDAAKFAVVFGAFGKWGADAARKVTAGLKAVYDKSGPLKWLIQGHIALFRKLGSTAVKAVGEALPWVAKLSAGLSLAAVATQVLSARLVAFGRSVASLGVLVAFLPALAGSFKLVRSTLTAVTRGIREELKPLGESFKHAENHAAWLGSRGIARIGQEFKKANMPAITQSMFSIATAANGAARQFGKWVNSAPGMKLIRDISRGTADGFKAAAPHIEKAVEALGNLANKADIRGRLKGVGEEIGRLADRFKKWADSKSAKDITGALQTLGRAFGTIGDKVKMVKDAIVWMADNGDKVKKFSDALAVVGVSIGVFTGGPLAVLMGALTLVANHWDTVKQSFSDTGALGKAWAAFRDDKGVRRVWDELKTAWSNVVSGFQSTIPLIRSSFDKLWPSIQKLADDLGPTLESLQPLFKVVGAAVGLMVVSSIESINFFITAIDKISQAWNKVVTTVGGLLAGLLNNVVAPMLDKLGSAVGVFDKGLGDKMHAAAEQVRQGAANINSYIQSINNKDVYVNIYMRTVGKNNIGGNKAQANAQAQRDLRGNATGTTHWQGGQTVVGEYGPELITLPKGSQVATAGASRMQAAHGRAGVSIGSGIFSNILTGMQKNEPAVFKYLRAFANRVAQMKVSTATKTRIQNLVTDYLPKFNILKNIDAVIDKQKQKIADLIAAKNQYAQSVAAANYGGAGSVIGSLQDRASGGSGNLASDFSALLEQRAGALRRFRSNLDALRKRGVSKDVLSQFAQAGVDQSGDLVQSLMGASGAVIGNINRQNASLVANSKGLGSQWASQMYDAGIKAAQGVLKGLQSQRAALEREMMRLAGSLVSAIKRALGIRSPSSVMADEVGRWIPEGVAAGVLKHTPKAVAAVRSMAAAAVPSTGRVPVSAGAFAGAASGALGVPGGGAAVIHSHVYLDGREVYESTQTVALRRESRNSRSGLTRSGA